MAHQALQFAETIRGMKLAMKRRADDSDSDSDDAARTHTNRGHKLQRRAKHVRQDRLDDTGGLAYRKRITHAGYARTTIATNPPRYDDDGRVYSPASSDDEAERCADPVQDDAFGAVRLENLLRPLTSAAELPDHPSLSLPFESKALTHMAAEALEVLRRERASLWKAKRLLQRFRGDADWVPCSTFETENDELLNPGEESLEHDSGVPTMLMGLPMLELQHPAGVGEGALPDAAEDEASRTLPAERAGDATEGVEAVDAVVAPPEEDVVGPRNDHVDHAMDEDRPPITNGGTREPAGEGAAAEHALHPAVMDTAEREANSETASNSNGTNTHAMTTRARARSPAGRSDRTPSPSPSDSASIPAVHPWFAAPSTALPDRDLGLPPGEAEDTRKLLLLYVQKQEQVVRSLDSLYTGLQRADRLRHLVYRSCKAEGHLVPDGKGNMVTEMSDGEDWYDMSDWKMQPWEYKDGQLEKGKDEVEDAEEEGRRRPGRGRRVNRI